MFASSRQQLPLYSKATLSRSPWMTLTQSCIQKANVVDAHTIDDGQSARVDVRPCNLQHV